MSTRLYGKRRHAPSKWQRAGRLGEGWSRRGLAFERLESRRLLAADVSITETGAPNPVAVGQQETYTLTVTNNDSANTASRVVVHDSLPSDASFVSGSTNPPGGDITLSFNTVTASVGDLAPGATATVTINVTFGAAGVDTNTVTATSDTSDDNQNNNTASVTTAVGESGGAADLSITNAGAPEPVAVGQQETYTLSVTNHDPANAASGVVATDTLPAGATVVSMSTSAAGGTVSQSNGTVTANLGGLAAGASESVTIVVTFAATGAVTNTAAVTSTTTDNNQGNNSSTFTTTVNNGSGTPTA